MQKQVTPAMIVVALIVLVIIIGLLWYFTMGRKAAPVPDEDLQMDPAMMEPPGGEHPTGGEGETTTDTQ
jgi:cell division protein FtsN